MRRCLSHYFSGYLVAVCATSKGRGVSNQSARWTEFVRNRLVGSWLSFLTVCFSFCVPCFCLAFAEFYGDAIETGKGTIF